MRSTLLTLFLAVSALPVGCSLFTVDVSQTPDAAARPAADGGAEPGDDGGATPHSDAGVQLRLDAGRMDAGAITRDAGVAADGGAPFDAGGDGGQTGDGAVVVEEIDGTGSLLDVSVPLQNDQKSANHRVTDTVVIRGDGLDGVVRVDLTNASANISLEDIAFSQIPGDESMMTSLHISLPTPVVTGLYTFALWTALGTSPVLAQVTVAQGEPGMPGKNSLIRTVTLPATIDCPVAGFAFESGVDENGDGTLSTAEVDETQTRQVCPFEHIITQSRTITVGSGKDYETPDAALAALRQKRVVSSAVVVIAIDPGTYVLTGNWNVGHLDGARIVVRGGGADPGDVRLTWVPGSEFETFIDVNMKHMARFENLTVASDIVGDGTAFRVRLSSTLALTDVNIEDVKRSVEATKSAHLDAIRINAQFYGDAGLIIRRGSSMYLDDGNIVYAGTPGGGNGIEVRNGASAFVIRTAVSGVASGRAFYSVIGSSFEGTQLTADDTATAFGARHGSAMWVSASDSTASVRDVESSEASSAVQASGNSANAAVINNTTFGYANTP